MDKTLSKDRRARFDLNRWLIGLRWWVGGLMIPGTWIALRLGFEFVDRATYLLGALILLYNFLLRLVSNLQESPDPPSGLARKLLTAQTTLDFCALLYLAHFTGGASSPFIFLFLLHITFAATLLPAPKAYGFTTFAVIGLMLLAVLEYLQWIPHHGLFFAHTAINLSAQPSHFFVEMIFFAATAYSVAFFLIQVRRQAGLSESGPFA